MGIYRPIFFCLAAVAHVLPQYGCAPELGRRWQYFENTHSFCLFYGESSEYDPHITERRRHIIGLRGARLATVRVKLPLFIVPGFDSADLGTIPSDPDL